MRKKETKKYSAEEGTGDRETEHGWHKTARCICVHNMGRMQPVDCIRHEEMLLIGGDVRLHPCSIATPWSRVLDRDAFVDRDQVVAALLWSV